MPDFTLPARLSRRQFIRITATAGLALAGGGLLARSAAARTAQRVTETRLLLGTVANLTVISDDPAQAQAAIQAAFDQMAALEDVLSRFRPASQLSRLNAAGRLANPHPALREVLVKALAYGDLTGGAFDVSVEPVLALYRASTRSGQLPTPAELEAAHALVDYRQIALEADEVRLGQSGMALSLDGIAKGYVIDRGADALAAHGYPNVLVELGGDLSAFGQAEERPWHIRIQQPDASESRLTAGISQRAMATSGDYQQPYTLDRRLNHIIDPASGISPLELSSASVVAPTACDADALATAVMVLGAQAGLALVRRLPNSEALVMTKDGAVAHTPGFPLIGA